MKKLILSILSIVAFTFNSFSQETLSNQSIKNMIGFGFEEQTIIDKIQTSTSDFDTTIQELKALKQLGASPTILSAMIKSIKRDFSDMEVKIVNKGLDLNSTFVIVYCCQSYTAGVEDSWKTAMSSKGLKSNTMPGNIMDGRYYFETGMPGIITIKDLETIVDEEWDEVATITYKGNLGWEYSDDGRGYEMMNFSNPRIREKEYIIQMLIESNK
jgi:hypothetical protein